MELHHLQFMHLQCLQVGELGILLKSVATFFCHLLNQSNHYIYWTRPCKMNIKFATEITGQTSKPGDSTASYIVNAVKIKDAVKCKMLLM